MLDWCAWWDIKTTFDPKDPVFTQEYFATVRRRVRGETGVFGMRLMGADLNFTTS